MTPKESLLKELETADEALIAETLSWVRSRKQNLTQALEAARSLPTDHQRATALADLAKLDSTHFPEALEAARMVKDPQKRAIVLGLLAKIVLPNSLISLPKTSVEDSKTEQLTSASSFVDVMENLRQVIESEGVEINPDKIWGDVRDKTPAPEQPCW